MHKYSPMNRINKTLIIIAIAAYSTFLFAGCQNQEKTPELTNDSSLNDITDSIYNETTFDEVPEMPELSFSRFGNDIYKIRRTLSDAEIASLSFDGYQFKDYDSAYYKVMLDSWKEYKNKYKPYYSAVICPSCRHNLLRVFGSTPNEYWQSLSGTEGWFAICTHCCKVLDFETVALN